MTTIYLGLASFDCTLMMCGLTDDGIRLNEYNDFEGPGEPVTGATGSLISSLGEVISGIGSVPYRIAKSTNKIVERRQRKRKTKQEGQHLMTNTGATQYSAGVDIDGDSISESRQDQEGPRLAAEAGSEQGSKGSTVDGLPGGQECSQYLRSPEPQARAPEVQTSTTNALRHVKTQQSAPGAADDNPAEELVNQVGRGAFKSAKALATAPVDLSLAVAQGFHNAPRLYGDDTVRRPPRVTGVRSGLRAARHEFAYGIYDGWTGLVRLPIHGARNGRGARGFVTGMGMGLDWVRSQGYRCPCWSNRLYPQRPGQASRASSTAHKIHPSGPDCPGST